MPGGLFFCLLLAALSEWSLSDALRWTFQDNAYQTLFWGLSYVGIAVTPPLWLLFSLDYSRNSQRLTPAKEAALFIIPALTIAFITLGLFGPTWSGTWFWVHAAYSYILMLAGIAVILNMFLHSTKKYRRQAAILLTAALLPLVYNIGYISTFFFSHTASVDLSPMVYCAMGLLIVWGVYKYRLFDILPAARETLIEKMSGGVLMIDDEGIVVDVNPIAREMLEIGEEVINQPTEKVLSRWPAVIEWCRGKACAPQEIMLEGPGGPRWVDMHAVLLLDSKGRVDGKVVTLWDITWRKKAEEELQRNYDELRKRERELQESEERWRRLVDNNPAGIIVHSEGKIIYANRIVSQKIGATSMEKIITQPVLRFVHPDYRTAVAERIRQGLENDLPASPMEEKYLLPDGGVINVEVTTLPITYMGKKAVLAVIWDIENRKQAEEKLTVSLKEKELLLKEIHHRVKNNLQIISSLLSLQAGSQANTGMATALKESQNRIKSMALIHEKLYKSKDLASIDMGEYARSLIDSLRYTYALIPDLRIDVDIEDISLDIDMAIPCGLIINELISNSLKYAFKGESAPVIRVSLHRDESNYRLIVSDNGAGLPPCFDYRHTTSLGMQLVTTLTEQLNGTIEQVPGKGTTFIITFSQSSPDE